MKIEEEITRAKVKLLIDQPWFGQLAAYIIPKPVKEASTAAINERGILFYNPDWLSSKSSKQIKTIICHEILHLAFGHLFRGEGRNPIIWNIAADLKVNEELAHSRQFEFPPGSLVPQNNSWIQGGLKVEDISHKNTEQIYNELWKQFLSSIVVGLDQIDLSGKGTKPDFSKIPQPWRTILKELVKDLLESERKMTDKGLNVPKKDLPLLAREWKDRVNQANQLSPGTVPAGLKRELDELENPQIPWHHLLRIRLSRSSSHRSWQRPTKKFLPFFFPAVKATKGLNAVVAFDTSGSITQKQLTKAVSETIGLAESFPSTNLWVMSSDAKVWDMVKIENGAKEKLRNLRPQGGGGTAFRPVFKKIKEKFGDRIDCLIFFTDGYASDSWPDKPPYPVYWVSDSTNVNWPFGKLIKL